MQKTGLLRTVGCAAGQRSAFALLLQCTPFPPSQGVRARSTSVSFVLTRGFNSDSLYVLLLNLVPHSTPSRREEIGILNSKLTYWYIFVSVGHSDSHGGTIGSRFCSLFNRHHHLPAKKRKKEKKTRKKEKENGEQEKRKAKKSKRKKHTHVGKKKRGSGVGGSGVALIIVF